VIASTVDNNNARLCIEDSLCFLNNNDAEHEDHVKRMDDKRLAKIVKNGKPNILRPSGRERWTPKR